MKGIGDDRIGSLEGVKAKDPATSTSKDEWKMKQEDTGDSCKELHLTKDAGGSPHLKHRTCTHSFEKGIFILFKDE